MKYSTFRSAFYMCNLLGIYLCIIIGSIQDNSGYQVVRPELFSLP